MVVDRNWRHPSVLTLLFTIGLVTLRKGHGWMFFFGIFFPLFWLVGAMMEPKTVQPT